MATMFVPLALEKQVEEATSAVEVKLSNTRVFKNEAGMIMTEYAFNVLENYNLSSEDLENKKLNLTMPGGTYDGVTSTIDGAPQFSLGEKSFLLLKKVESKNYLSNFTLGKYKIQSYEGKTYYVSEVFPLDPKIGRISKDKMIDLMKTKWKTSFSTIEDLSPAAGGATMSVREKKIEKVESPIVAIFKKIDREPAQTLDADESVPFSFWGSLFIVVFFFSVIFFKLGQSGQKHKSE